MRRRHFVLNLLAAGALASPALAQGHSQYVFTGFDVPGSISTVGDGVNRAGTIAGWFQDSGGMKHGYVWSGGTFAQFDVPGAVATRTWAINDVGVIVGRTDYPVENQAHGFIHSGGNFTTYDAPGATWTEIRGMNNNSVAVGTYHDANGLSHGFLLNGGQFTTIDYPNMTNTAASAINDNGQIVGTYQDGTGTTHGFLLSGGRFTSFSYPKAVYTEANKINLAGVGMDDATGSTVLVRSTFPTGRVLDRVKTEVLTCGRPCWFPDGSDRILFAGTDRRLYVFEFPRVRGAGHSASARAPPPPHAVRWEVEPPGVGEVWFQYPCWPTGPALGGRLIVALSCIDDASRREWKSRLWWLQVSADADAIVGAERSIVAGTPGQSQVPQQEFLPSVGTTKGGTPLLAYMAMNRYLGPLELWVSPIVPAAPDRGPRVLRAAGRKLAEN
jgi:probable HAF family extracellular repeat protein